MRIYNSFLLWLTAGLLLSAPVGFSADETYAVEEEGRSTLSALLGKHKSTSAEQWEYARAAQNDAHLKRAGRRMVYLVRRWPNSLEAPWAQRARADMLLASGELKAAFKEYQYLIDNYSGRMRDYDGALQSQFDIAVEIMNQRHMRWLFGGYRAPEYAVDYFEDLIRNGPQWPRAPEAQFLIGQCHQEAGDLEMAVVAYGMLGYRYPDSTFAEEGAWQQITCLDELRMDYPNSVDLLDRTLTATTVFLSTYPTSEYKIPIIRLRNELYEIKAGKLFSQAEFYAKVPKKPEAAILYFEQMIEEYPKSQLVPEAQRRITEIRGLMVRMPEAPSAAPIEENEILPTVEETTDAAE